MTQELASSPPDVGGSGNNLQMILSFSSARNILEHLSSCDAIGNVMLHECSTFCEIRKYLCISEEKIQTYRRTGVIVDKLRYKLIYLFRQRLWWKTDFHVFVSSSMQMMNNICAFTLQELHIQYYIIKLSTVL